MKKEELHQSWSGLSEDILTGMLEWRLQHPRATFREIEAEVDQRLAVLRAKMIADAAMACVQTEWETGSPAGVCPECGQPLEKKGKKKRQLQTRGGQEIELKRDYGMCPACGQGIFPPG